jgi:RNA polymerase sigma-70 factor, ECF subfamily
VTTLSVLDPQASLAPITRCALAVQTACAAAVNAASSDRDALVRAAVNGDAAAIDSVLRWIRPLVLRYCRTRVGGQERTFTSADDVAQEVCIAVLTALPAYRDQGRPFLAFVYGIAAHKVADAHRSAARNRTEPVADLPDTTDITDGPEAQVMNGEFAGRMARLLEAVSDKQREILHLRVVVGLSVEETAEVVGSTPGAVRVAQHRALSRLRDLLTTTPSAGPKTKAAATSAASVGGQPPLFTEWTAGGRAVW